MRFRYLKHNIYRQFVLYAILALTLLLTYDSIVINQSTLELVLVAPVGIITIASIAYQYFSYVIIDDEGIRHKSLCREYMFAWDKAGQVKIIQRRQGKAIWVIILKSSNPKDLYLKKNGFNRYMKCITFAATGEAVKQIIKYRGKENLFDQKLFNTPIYNKLRRY